MASKTPKAMSSRLLTMKFMQRGIASASTGSSSPTTPKDDDEPSFKRRKIGQSLTDARPSFDEKAVQAALEEEERKRQAAIEKQAAELGDTRWVLDIPASLPAKPGWGPQKSLNIVQIGFAQVDAGDAVAAVGGAQIRRFNMKKAKPQDGRQTAESDNQDSDSGDDEAADEDDDTASDSSSQAPDDRNARGRSLTTSGAKGKRSRSDLSTRRAAEKMKAQEYSSKRRKKEVRLNTMPISSGGSSRPRTASRKSYH